MIAVMGATGRTGGGIVRRLLEAGEPVRALGRSQRRLFGLKIAGAEVLAGAASDAAYLTDAFRRAESVFTLLPYDPTVPDYHAGQARMGEAITEAIRAAEVRRVVFLSSVGADLPSGTGFIASLYAQEQRLRQLGAVDVLVLRCGSFFENFAASLDLIRTAGINGDTVAPDVRVPMIATRDIATVATGALLDPDWEGFTVRELLGERDLSYAEATGIIGARLGQPDLPYVQFPDGELAAALAAAGFAADSIRSQLELNRALNDGTIVSREGRTTRNTTPTRFEDYALELAADYALTGAR